MARDISVSISVQGEREYRTALKDAQSAVKLLDSELKASEAAFDGSANAQEHYANKTRLISAQIEQQKTILKSLEQAVKEAGKEFGESSAKTDYFRIEVNKTHASIAKLERAFRESEAEMAELGRDSGRVGRQLEQGIGEAADDVSRKFDQMVNKLSMDIGGIRSTLNFGAAFEIGGAVLEGVKGAYDAVTGLVDSSMDYNRQMSFLEVNAAAAGYSFEKIKQYAMDVSVITGDMDAAIEGMSSLLKAGFEGDELAKVVERLSGAIIQMPDTMKFESLAESLLESVSTGSAVGQYAEYLEKMGMDIETVNEALAEARKNGQEAAETAALSLLSGHGAEEVLAQWETDNAEMIEYYQAQASLTEAQAALAKELTPAATAAVELATELIEGGTALIEKAIELYNLISEGDLMEENPKVQEARENLPDWNNGYITGAEEAGESDGEEYINGVKKSIIEEAPELPTWDDFAGGYETGLDSLFDSEVAALAGEKAGDAGVDGIGSAVESDMPALLQSLETDGKNAISGFADGILASSDEAVSAANTVWNLVNARLSRPFSFPSLSLPNGGNASGQSGVGSAAGTRGVSLYLDGRELGRTSADYISAEQGARVDRYETYGY